MELLKNKRIATYASLVIPVVAIVLTIVGAATQGLVGDTFSPLIVTFLVLGAVLSVVCFLFNDVDFLNMPLPIFFGLALGFIFRDGIEVLVYGSIGIDNNVGGQSALTVTYLVLGAIAFILSIASVFFNHSSKDK